MANTEKPDLSELEHTIMSVVWERGRATAESIRIALGKRQQLKDSTVRTVLRRLEEKGYVQHETEGRTYVYSPTEPRQSVAAAAVRGIVKRLCDDSVESLLVGMVEKEVVSPEELERLARRIAAARRNDRKQASRKRPPGKGD